LKLSDWQGLSITQGLLPFSSQLFRFFKREKIALKDVDLTLRQAVVFKGLNVAPYIKIHHLLIALAQS
jgi:hypothetical protein